VEKGIQCRQSLEEIDLQECDGSEFETDDLTETINPSWF
jgi:hypothetical protein